MTVPMKQIDIASGEIMESVLIKGDLSKLTPQERSSYYMEVCRSAGLNPLTKPFEYITLNGKLTLYALRACTDQLRKVNGVSLEIVSRDVTEDILTVHVRAKMPDGRFDEDLGTVPFSATLKGEARANAELKCITKAKRRATLSICGLGWLDETEVEDIPAHAKRPAPPAANVMTPHDVKTGEVLDPEPRVQEWGDYVDRWANIITEATDAKQLHDAWNAGKEQRAAIAWPDDDGKEFGELKARVEAKINSLKAKTPA